LIRDQRHAMPARLHCKADVRKRLHVAGRADGNEKNIERRCSDAAGVYSIVAWAARPWSAK
jgi:hypothetical protein